MAGSDIDVSPMNLSGCPAAAALEPQPLPFTSGQSILVPSHQLPSTLQGWGGTYVTKHVDPLANILEGISSKLGQRPAAPEENEWGASFAHPLKFTPRLPCTSRNQKYR